MSKGITIELQGYKEIMNKLKEMPVEKRRVVSKAVKTCAVNIAADAQRSAGAQGIRDKGFLISRITSDDISELSAEAKSGANYSAYWEFGTGGLVDVPKGLEAYAMTFKGKGVKQINLPAKPFFFPAVFKHQKILIDQLKIELNK